MKKILVLMVVVFISAMNLYAQGEDKNFPQTVNYTGNLFDKSGKPIDGHVDLNIKFYKSIIGGSPLWSEDQRNVQVEYGYFSVNLGTETPLHLDFSKPLWIELTVNGKFHSRMLFRRTAYTFVRGQNFIPQSSNLKDGIDSTILTKINESESPYIMIIKDTSDKIDAELTKTDVDVNISGFIADVTVKQYYRTFSDQIFDAVYIFPASVHSSVYSMKVKIGTHEVTAIIKEKEENKNKNEETTFSENHSTLLVLGNKNLFSMNLANIAPSDLIEIEMKYTEILAPLDGIYTFTFPTLLAPLYMNDDISSYNSKTKQNIELINKSAFNIKLNLLSAIPIENIECKTHNINLANESANHSQISLTDSENHGSTNDFVVKYKLVDDKINAGLLLSKGKDKYDENFFLLTIQPPVKIDTANIPKREYIFIVDASGHRYGFPSVLAKKTILNLVEKLTPKDKFNLITFARDIESFSDTMVNANLENLEKALFLLPEAQGGGKADIFPALEKAYMISKLSNSSRSIVIITHNKIDFEEKTLELIRKNLNVANVFVLNIVGAMGNSTYENIARAGNCLYFEVHNLKEAENQSERFINYISNPILTDINLTYDGFGASEIEPISVPELFQDKPIIIYGKWNGHLKGTIKINGVYDMKPYSIELPVAKYGLLVQGDALKQYWAYKKIESLSDYNNCLNQDKFKEEITDLGLKYNLMTDYTYFIAKTYQPILQSSNIDDKNIITRQDDSNFPLEIINQQITKQFLKYYNQESIINETNKINKPVVTKKIGDVIIESQGYPSRIRCNTTLGFENRTSYLSSPNTSFFDCLNDIFHKEKNRSVEYVKSLKKVEYSQQALNFAAEGHICMQVIVNNKGKIQKIEPFFYNNEILNDLVVDALLKTRFKPARINGKNVLDTVAIELDFLLPVKDYLIDFLGKKISITRKIGISPIYRFFDYQKGTGANIKFADKVKLESLIFNEKQELVIKDSITITKGIGELASPLEDALNNMQIGSEKLLLFESYLLNPGLLYPSNNEIKQYSRNLYIKIKVLEIIPKINKL